MIDSRNAPFGGPGGARAFAREKPKTLHEPQWFPDHDDQNLTILQGANFPGTKPPKSF
ncbi:MAG: hypothetical protein ACREDG_02315 [Methylocella sp.]